jgi:HEAT repeat protein
LVDVLRDENADVRAAAIRALASFKNVRTVSALASALKDPDPMVRETAAVVLRNIGNQEAFGPLAEALKDPSTAVRRQAAKGLKDLAWEPADNAERAHFLVALGEIDKATILGADAVDAIMLVMHDGADYQRRAAVEALSQVADGRIVGLLISTLKDKDVPVRTAAVDALRRIGDQRAVAPLILALRDPYHQVRTAGAEALGQIGDPQAVEPLVKLLRDKNWEVRAATALALGRFRDPQTIEPVVKLLTDSDREVREAAVNSLSAIGDGKAITPLVLALKDEEDSVRQVAAKSLRLLDPMWERSEAAQLAVPDLKASLKAKEYWVRQSAASVLARIGEMQSAPAPVRGLAEPFYYRRQEAVEALIGALADFDRELRLASVEALGRMGQVAAVEPLTRSLQDADPAVRGAASKSLELLSVKPKSDTSFLRRDDPYAR